MGGWGLYFTGNGWCKPSHTWRFMMGFSHSKISLGNLVFMFQEWVSFSRPILWNYLHLFWWFQRCFIFNPIFGASQIATSMTLQPRSALTCRRTLSPGQLHSPSPSRALWTRNTLQLHWVLSLFHQKPVLKTPWINWWIKIIEMDPPILACYTKNSKNWWYFVVPRVTSQSQTNQRHRRPQDHVGGTVDVDLEIKALRVVDKARGRRQGTTTTPLRCW